MYRAFLLCTYVGRRNENKTCKFKSLGKYLVLFETKAIMYNKRHTPQLQKKKRHIPLWIHLRTFAISKCPPSEKAACHFLGQFF